MPHIRVLSFETANLIAAGEVVDRPASVLKELLENAIDAGATRICAEIRQGGVSMIRVVDNGCGMAAEDLPVSIRRHATSKIRTSNDLSSISTLGFRGEALAAIAAVSRLRILSKTKEAEMGTMLTSDGGTVLDISEVGTADGTTVLVEGLFSNVPARRKFLKKDVTETMAATAVVEKIAMSRPDISFEWITDGETRFKTVGDGDLKNTLYAVLGREFAMRLLPVEGGVGGIRVRGFIGTSDNVRQNRNHQNFFINQRYVKSKTVMAALEKAYTSYIAPERFPVCALFTDVLPSAVDVNVHPAKLEVKFSDERAVFEAVYYAVRTALEENERRPELTLPKEKPSPFAKGTGGEQISSFHTLFSPSRPVQKDLTSRTDPAPQITFEKAVEEIRNFRDTATEEAPLAPLSTPQTQDGAFASSPASREDEWVRAATPDLTVKGEKNGSPAEVQAAPEADVALKAREEAKEKKPYRLIGEAFRCYLFVEQGEELLVIDKHAAHERILFEELLKEQKKDGRVASQGLLVSLPVTLSEEEAAAAEEYREELEAVGFAYTVKKDGKGAYLHAVPNAVEPADAVSLFSEMTLELAEGRGNPARTEAARREKSLYQVACKAAIKGGRLYGDAQIEWLVDRVMALDDITVCPHGRPIAMRLKKTELDRRFCRIM